MNNGNHNIYFSTRDELTKVCLDDVMYAISDGNYVVVKFKSGRKLTLLASLQNFIQAVEAVCGVHFERIGRSHVVNMAYVTQVNILRKTIVLVDDEVKTAVELSVPRDAIKQLKQVISESPRKDVPDFLTANGKMEAFQIIES